MPGMSRGILSKTLEPFRNFPIPNGETCREVPQKTNQTGLGTREFCLSGLPEITERLCGRFLAIHWPNWETHKAEVLGLIHNEECRSTRNNPLERVMSISTRPDGADLETTIEHLAQRLGKYLDRAFKGKIKYQWSHNDKLGGWNGKSRNLHHVCGQHPQGSQPESDALPELPIQVHPEEFHKTS